MNLKRLAFASVCALVCVGMFGGSSAAKPAPCTVTPNPVSISATGTYTVTSTGGIPAEFYEVIVSQKHDGVTDEGRDWLGQADAEGTVTATLDAHPWTTDDHTGLLVGDASVSVVRYRTGGGPGGAASKLASCKFAVVV